MKYAIYSDVDGTIYSFNQKYHPEVKKYIKMAQNKGVEFIMTTGNPFLQNMKDMAKDLEVDYFIGSNGAFMYDVKNNKEININVLSVEEGQQVLDIMNEMEIGADWWDSKNMYVNEFVTDEVKQILSNIIDKKLDIKTSNVIVDGIHKIEAYAPNTPEGIKSIDVLEEKLKVIGLQLARMKPFHIEITKMDVSKGAAVKAMSKHLGIELDNVMTIGDSANDHSMFAVTNYAYAMGNASAETKSKANFHTSSVEQNGLGEAILDFMFRKRLTSNFDGQDKK